MVQVGGTVAAGTGVAETVVEEMAVAGTGVAEMGVEETVVGGMGVGETV